MDAQTTPLFQFDNSYARLPERFFASLPPTQVLAPRLIKVNEGLARELGVDPARLASDEGIAALSGNVVPIGAEPVALAYAGHQFGNFVPQLGDGRAVLLGEVIDVHGRRRDIQLKGSGPTPFSRRGDGRAALGPVLREYIVSEAMAALGVPTTRSLAAVSTGETVWRETPLPGAVLTRVASSHVRAGTFQYFAVREDIDALRTLTGYVIARHYPENASAPNKARALLDGAVARQAFLVAKWLLVGFIHGVMNTDNMAVSGETIDYGPCAFMDAYNPRQVYSSIDEMGRYAYGNQPAIAQWNLARLAETLLPLLGDTEEAALAEARAALDAFAPKFNEAYLSGLRVKIGLAETRDGDDELAQDLLKRMAEGLADFTLTFRKLADLADGGEGPRDLFVNPLEFDAWAARWKQRTAQERGDSGARAKAMRAVNPAFIPRNHRIEFALAAAEQGDFSQFETMVAVLSKPFDDQPEHAIYAASPEPDQIVQRTFCGT
ncbi:MAG TPA: YdiU family protein [Rhizomicrobium sp.]|nr:YdiU family protein [Rhizomicrobium sp.]